MFGKCTGVLSVCLVYRFVHYLSSVQKFSVYVLSKKVFTVCLSSVHHVGPLPMNESLVDQKICMLGYYWFFLHTTIKVILPKGSRAFVAITIFAVLVV